MKSLELSYYIAELKGSSYPLSKEKGWALSNMVDLLIQGVDVSEDEALEVLAICSQSVRSDIVDKSNGVLGLCKLIERGLLPEGDVEEVINLLADNLNEETTASDILWAIDELLSKKHTLEDATVEKIHELLIECSESDDVIKHNAVSGLVSLIHYISQTNQVIGALIATANCQEPDEESLRNIAVGGVNELIKADKIPEEKLAEVLGYLMKGVGDSYEEVRINATGGIGLLAETNKIADDDKEGVLSLCDTLLKDHVYVVGNAVKIIKHLGFPAQKIDYSKEKKHRGENFLFIITSPLEYPICLTRPKNKEIDALVIELEKLRHSLRLINEDEGLPSKELNKINRLRIEVGKYEGEEARYLKDVIQYINILVDIRERKQHLDEIPEPLNNNDELLSYYHAYLTYKNMRLQKVMYKDDFVFLKEKYKQCADLRQKEDILRMLLSNLSYLMPEFYITDDQEKALRKSIYDLCAHDKDLLGYHIDMLDLIIAGARQKFFDNHFPDKLKHEIYKDALQAMSTLENGVPSSLTDRTIVVDNLLSFTKIKGNPLPLSTKRLAKFVAHLITPGFTKFDGIIQFDEKLGLTDKYKKFLCSALREDKLLDSIRMIDIERTNKDVLIAKVIEHTAKFFKDNNIVFSEELNEAISSKIGALFERIHKDRIEAAKLLEAFMPAEAVTLLLVTAQTNPIYQSQSLLHECLLSEPVRMELCSVLKNTAQIANHMRSYFPYDGAVHISSYNKVWELSECIMNALEEGESIILQTGHPRAQGERVSSHFFYTILKQVNGGVKIVIVNGGNTKAAVVPDSKFVDEGTGIGANWLCQETETIMLSEPGAEEFLRHYIYQTLMLPCLEYVKEANNPLNSKNLVENIYLCSAAGFKGKDLSSINYVPKIVGNDEKQYSMPSQIFGNCTVYNLQFALRFLFDWNEAQFTHFMHDAVCRYNFFLYTSLSKTNGVLNAEDIGGESMYIKPLVSMKVEDDFYAKDFKVQIDEDIGRARARSI